MVTQQPEPFSTLRLRTFGQTSGHFVSMSIKEVPYEINFHSLCILYRTVGHPLLNRKEQNNKTS